MVLEYKLGEVLRGSERVASGLMSSDPLQIKVHTIDGADHIVSCDTKGEFDREETWKTMKAENIHSVVFPEGLLHTGKLCENCANLVSVTLPEGLKAITHNAFSMCIMLPSIKIPASVEIIDMGAFAGCKSLEDIFLPRNVELGRSVFADCTMFLDFYIPPGVKTIPQYAFAGCTSLGSITFFPGTGLEKIEEGAFKGCTNLRNVDIPEGVTAVGYKAFGGCTKLEEIIFPSTLGRDGYGTDIVQQPVAKWGVWTWVFPTILLAKYETSGEQWGIKPSYFDERYFAEKPDAVEEKILHVDHDHQTTTDEWDQGEPDFEVTAWGTDEGGERPPNRARTEGALYDWTGGET
jgi:hypothetical protein